ncbi:hypothetical protein Pan4_31 [Pseudanabaena phage Pan4]|nr:hypothetical protein Pan4_31 [Pseudanabaena phage Pan4]
MAAWNRRASLSAAAESEAYERGLRDAAAVINRGKLFTIRDRVEAILALIPKGGEV